MPRFNVCTCGSFDLFIPYVLYVSKNAATEERDAIISKLESYVMRRMVLHVTTKNYNRLFTSLILNQVLTVKDLVKYLSESDDTTMFVPSDDALYKGFNESKLSNLQSKGIVYFIESYKRTSKDSTQLLGFSSYSLEHLMPKKWRNEWIFNGTEEQQRERDSILLTLGNLAIITQTLNSSIRDSSWSKKKSGKSNDNPGLDSCASGLYTMNDVLQQDEWNESKIRDRAKWLFEQAKEMWKI